MRLSGKLVVVSLVAILSLAVFSVISVPGVVSTSEETEDGDTVYVINELESCCGQSTGPIKLDSEMEDDGEKERPEKPEKEDDGEKERPDRPDRPDQPENPGKNPERPERPDRPEMPERPDKTERPEMPQVPRDAYITITFSHGAKVTEDSDGNVTSVDAFAEISVQGPFCYDPVVGVFFHRETEDLTPRVDNPQA